MTNSVDQAVNFLAALFVPGDWVLLRPIETWTEAGRKRSRVDYPNVRHIRVGIGDQAGNWHPWREGLEAVAALLIESSKENHTGISVGVCPRFGGKGRFDLAWQIRTVRASWIDLDDCTVAAARQRCKDAGLPDPSVVVSSGSGVHLYWLLDEPYRIDDADDPPPVHESFDEDGMGKRKRTTHVVDPATGEKLALAARQNVPTLSPKAVRLQDILSGIAAKIGGDHTHDLSRLLRLPGTMNRKDERNGREPAPCALVECHTDRRYSIETFAVHEKTSPAAAKRQKIEQVRLPGRKKKTQKQQDRLHDLLNECAAAESGSRSEADYALCCFAIEQGISRDDIWQEAAQVGKFAEQGERYFDRTWDAAAQHTRQKIFEQTTTRAKARTQRKQDAAAAVEQAAGDAIEADDDPDRLARLFLAQTAQHRDGHTLKWWKSEWWQWTGSKYVVQPDLACKIHAIVKAEFNRISLEKQEAAHDYEAAEAQKVTRPLVSNIIEALKSMTLIDHETIHGTWLDWRLRPNCIALRNGILDVDHLLAGKDREECFQDHTPLWFSPVALPFDFNPDAECPEWKQVLDRNLEGDHERIDLLQEWAGYLLLPDTGQQRFMMLEGEGANGKSVFVAGLTAMLGEENVSNVPLELFGQQFPLTNTLGKLANIAPDAAEIDKPAEGNLKSFTGGDMMFFDRKGLKGINAVPTARLMICVNNRPRFSDRSQGLWRRLILVPFRLEIPPSQRKKNLDKAWYWTGSGELPGIFNWALAGLHRLRQQGDFTTAQVCEEAAAEFRIQANPARNFLTDHCEENDLAKIPCRELFASYKKWCQEMNARPLGEREFGKEVRRVFKNCERRKLGTRGNRESFYQGIFHDPAGGF